MECLHEALKEKGCEKQNPGFECENQMRSSGTVENLTTGCQSEMCVLTVLCNAYQIISHTASTQPHQCRLTIAWKDSVKTTLG